MLDYPLTDYVFDGARRALLTMAQIQFEAGAKVVSPGARAGRRLPQLAGSARRDRRAADEAAAVARRLRARDGRLRDRRRRAARRRATRRRPLELANVSVHDGSIFPTSIGANPQLSIYGITARLASGLAARLTGRETPAFADPQADGDDEASAGPARGGDRPRRRGTRTVASSRARLACGAGDARRGRGPGAWPMRRSSGSSSPSARGCGGARAPICISALPLRCARGSAKSWRRCARSSTRRSATAPGLCPAAPGTTACRCCSSTATSAIAASVLVCALAGRARACRRFGDLEPVFGSID